MDSKTFICSKNWNPKVVFLSISVAFVGSYGALTLYEQYRLCSRENKPKMLSPPMLMIMMSFSLGGISIWWVVFVEMPVFWSQRVYCFRSICFGALLMKFNNLLLY